MKNVYLVGKAGSGKTYSANFLRDTYQFQTAKFAFPVYGIAEDYFDMKTKDRTLLQLIGTEAGRDLIDTDLWVNRFREDITIVQKTKQLLNLPIFPYVLDDCRFPNEHKVLQSMGWVGIYLSVSEEIRLKRLVKRDGSAQEQTLNHFSEIASDLFKDDLIQIDCNGSIDESNQNLDVVIKKYVL